MKIEQKANFLGPETDMQDTFVSPRAALLSVVLPVYNNSATLRELTNRLLAQAETLFGSAEILFINDGSRDDSSEVINALCATDDRLRGIHFTRNFGQHAAMLAGMRHSRGDYVLCMDADLEEDPATLPSFVKALEDGFEIAMGLRANRRTDSFKHWTAKAYYELNNLLCDYPVQRDAANMRLMTRKFVDYLMMFSERPFYGGFTSWIGLPVALVPIHWNDQGRKSSFTISKLISHARLGIIGFSTKLLRLATVLGVFLSMGSGIFGLFLLARYLTFGIGVPGFFTIALLCLLAVGIFSIFLGILGEYVSEIHIAFKARPHYLIHSAINLPPMRRPPCGQ